MLFAPKTSVLIRAYRKLRNKISVFACLIIGLICSSGNTNAQFNNATNLIGTPQFTTGSPHGNGVSFYDFNKDGWDDLSFSGNNQQLHFLVNNNGVLEPAPFSIPNPSSAQVNMLLWADFDNDGDADLLITKYNSPIQLWQNDGSFNFTNVAGAAGLEQANFFYTGAAFCDYNHDGCLDLYIGKFYHSTFNPGLEYRGMLYKSNCNGTFDHVTEEAGVLVSSRPIFQPVFLDYNNDGWEDLYLVTDRLAFPNELFHNNGDGTFTSVTQTSGAGINIDAMSGTIGDYDNDGDLDIFCTNNPYPTGHVLLQNQGNGSFIQMQNDAGLYLVQVGWGSMWLDYNNDSYQDLFVSVTSPVMSPIGNQFYVNQSDGTFLQSNQDVGLGGDLTQTYVAAMGDLNNDGYYDFMTNNALPHESKLYQNTTQSNNYFAFTLQGTLSNKDGIGTWVHCYAGGNHYVRYTLCGENLLGQNSAKTIFGLGEITLIDSLVLEWNRGTQETYYNLAVNQHMHFVEGITFSLPFSIVIAEDEFLCPGDSVVLDAGEHPTYLWNTGHTERYLTVFESGWYQVSVTSPFGLPVLSNPVIIENAPVTETEILVQDISCFGFDDGAIAVNISNAPIQSIDWSNGMQQLSINNLSSGVYSFMVYDSYGCLVIGSAVISEPEPLSAWTATESASCYGGSDGLMTVTPFGGTSPYSITWPVGDPNQTSAGIYTVSVTDSNNCIFETNVEVNEPLPIETFLSLIHQNEDIELGQADISVGGGTAPYNILWSTGETENAIFNLLAGPYWVVVTDFHQCYTLVEFNINFLTQIGISGLKEWMIFPNPAEDFITVQAPENIIEQIIILNHMGQKVIMHQPDSNPTKIHLSHLSSGSYLLLSNTTNGTFLHRFCIAR